MRRKITPKKNRFLHATNPRSDSKKLINEQPTKQTTYIEYGFDKGLPFLKKGKKEEKIIYDSHDNEENVRRFTKMI